jgi:hypothetical protein
MPYVERDARGRVIAVRREATPLANEYVPDSHPDYLEFFGRHEDIRVALEDSDRSLARVTEDLIELLVRKGVIMVTELPAEVQAKLRSRLSLRSRLTSSCHDLLSDDETL